MPFTIGVWRSYEETAWAASLQRFGLTGTQVTALMTDLVTNGLTEKDAILLTSMAAIRNINANNELPSIPSRADPGPADPVRSSGLYLSSGVQGVGFRVRSL